MNEKERHELFKRGEWLAKQIIDSKATYEVLTGAHHAEHRERQVAQVLGLERLKETKSAQIELAIKNILAYVKQETGNIYLSYIQEAEWQLKKIQNELTEAGVKNEPEVNEQPPSSGTLDSNG